MIIVFVMIFLLCLPHMKLSAKNGFEDYMSPQKTGSIKGIFVIIILFSHMRQYVIFDRSLLANDAFYWVMNQIGQLMVVMFFFYSGYGIMQAIEKKKFAYVRSMPKRRILKTFLHFELTILIYLFVNYCIGLTFPVERILLSLVAWSAVGNSSWFMLAIFLMYIATYLAFLIFREKRVAGTVLVTVLMAVYIAVMWKIKGIEEYWYFDTAMCYPLGMWYSLAKPRIDAKLLPSFKKWLIVSLSLIAVFTALNVIYCGDRFKYLFLFIIEALVLAVIIAIVTMRVSINNSILRWFGARVFSIYMLQRVPMILLNYYGLTANPYVFVLISLAATIAIAEIFDRFTGKTDRLLKL